MSRRFIFELLENGAPERRTDAAPSLPSMPSRPTPKEKILNVSQAVRAIRTQLEQSFYDLYVEGEISSLSRPSSGHWYFTLKDARCQLPAVMFARDNRRVRFAVENGQAVIARGRVTFYEGGGRTQLSVQELEPAGIGAKALALRQLAEKLAREGLFDQDNKQTLPMLPRRVGVVTSPTGAAFRDILQVATRRFAGIPIVLAASKVQGDGADAEIARAVQRLDTSRLCDVIIVGRGGGSAEDLEAFSSESVVRAVAVCQTPIVSAVGHEIDTALCDLAADVRAPTPSAAAELVFPLREHIQALLLEPVKRAQRSMHIRLTHTRLKLERMSSTLPTPTRIIWSKHQDVDQLLRRGQDAILAAVAHQRTHLVRRQHALEKSAPGLRLLSQRNQLEELQLRNNVAVSKRYEVARARLSLAAGHMHALSPLAVLGRGYSICLHNGKAVRNANVMHQDDQLDIRLWKGQIVTRVIAVQPCTDPENDDKTNTSHS